MSNGIVIKYLDVMKGKFQNFLPVFAIVWASFIVYSSTFSVPFQFDDLACITGNRTVLHFEKINDIWNWWPTRFLTYISFALNYRINEFNVFGYHLVNLLVHTGCCLLVWLIAKKILTQVMNAEENFEKINITAFFSAMIFAVHPVQTQAVTYIYQRHTSLATLFILSSFLSWINAVVAERKKILWLILSFISAICGMLTKEISIVIPFLIFAHFLIFRKYFSSRIKTWKVILYSLFLFSIIAAFLFRYAINPSEIHRVKAVQGPPTQTITQKDYFLTQEQAFLIYTGLLILPLRQNLDYDISVSQGLFSPPETFYGFLLIILLVALCIIFFKGNRIFSFSIVFFIISVLPQSSFVPKPDIVVEHRLYLAMAGYAIFVSSFFLWFLQKKKHAVIFLTVLVCFYGLLTIYRNSIWKDPVLLWSDTISKSPGKARPYLNRGLAYAKRADIKNALKDYNTAIKINPWYAEAYNNRAIIYASMKEYEKALQDFNRAIELNPEFSASWNNRGVLFSSMGKWKHAFNNFDTALKLKPYYVDALKNRAIAYILNNRFDEAIRDLSSAIDIHPRNGELYNYRATAFLLEGKKDNAVKDALIAKNLGFKIDASLEKILQEKGARQ